jgi:RNA polymerase sigma-70 factor (ECF subfamily)
MSPAEHAELNDDELVQLCRTDKDSFSELYHRHLRRVYLYSLSRTGHVEDAEDITAQTFVAALENLNNYRGESSFAVWLLGIARRKLTDHLRRDRQELPLERADEFAVDTSAPEELVEKRMQWEAVAQQIVRLKSNYAEVLALRVFGGLSSAETGAVMNKSEGAINTLFYRAVRELREQVHQSDQEMLSHDDQTEKTTRTTDGRDQSFLKSVAGWQRGR